MFYNVFTPASFFFLAEVKKKIGRKEEMSLLLTIFLMEQQVTGILFLRIHIFLMHTTQYDNNGLHQTLLHSPVVKGYKSAPNRRAPRESAFYPP